MLTVTQHDYIIKSLFLVPIQIKSVDFPNRVSPPGGVSMIRKLVAMSQTDLLERFQLPPVPHASEDGMRTDGSPGTFEWWYFDVHAGDQFSVVVAFFTKSPNRRGGPLEPRVEITITRPNPDDPRTPSVLKFDHVAAPIDFRASKNHCEVHLGRSWVSGNLDTYQLHVEFQSVLLDLTFERIAPSWRPNIYMQQASHNPECAFGWFPGVPSALVRGSLNLNGEYFLVAGRGYHDHNWGTHGIEQCIANWLWGRVFLEPYTLIFANIRTNWLYGDRLIPAFFLAKDGDILVQDELPMVTTIQHVRRHPETNKVYPAHIHLLWTHQKDKVEITLDDPCILQAINALLDFPAWQRQLINLVYTPYYFRFEANYHIEISLGKTREQVSGKGIYEAMLLDWMR
jgi:predicted secreted hydrolase